MKEEKDIYSNLENKKEHNGLFIVLNIFLILVSLLTLCFYLQAKNQKLEQNSLKEKIVQGKNINQEEIVESDEEIMEKYPEVLNFLFFGDLMLDRHVKELIAEKGLSYIFEELAGQENRFFKGVDLISANLEGVVTNEGEHYPPTMIYDFAFHPELIQGLKNYNFNFFNLANNHFSDQGQQGVEETRENLTNLGFNYSGCIDRQVGECSSKILELSNYKIGLAGFSMVYGKFNQEEANKIIQDLAKNTDLVIVNIHWGSGIYSLSEQFTTRNCP